MIAVKIRKLIAAAMLFLPIQALAVNWIEIQDGEEATLYLDVDSPFTDEGYVMVWTMGDIKKDITRTGARSFRSLWQIDCDRKRMRVLQMPLYNSSMGEGRPTASSKSGKTDWEYPIPQSVNSTIHGLMCIWKDDN